MNRMIGRGEPLTSSITDFNRFSNSPFTPAPAWSSARSSRRRETLRCTGGTSPAAMRRAKPSTTAVFPTPASPTRIGLFCRRRVRMSITWRISESRPRIGSISPARARAVRSTVYWSRAGVGEDSKKVSLGGASPSAGGAAAGSAGAAGALPRGAGGTAPRPASSHEPRKSSRPCSRR